MSEEGGFAGGKFDGGGGTGGGGGDGRDAILPGDFRIRNEGEAFVNIFDVCFVTTFSTEPLLLFGTWRVSYFAASALNTFPFVSSVQPEGIRELTSGGGGSEGGFP